MHPIMANETNAIFHEKYSVTYPIMSLPIVPPSALQKYTMQWQSPLTVDQFLR